MALAGSYELVRSEGVEEFFKAVAPPRPENAPPPENRGSRGSWDNNITISIDGDQVTIDHGDPKYKPVYTLNKEIEEPSFGGRTRKATATLDDGALAISSTGQHGLFKRVYTLSGSELVVTLSSSKPGVPEAKRFYKKL